MVGWLALAKFCLSVLESDIDTHMHNNNKNKTTEQNFPLEKL